MGAILFDHMLSLRRHAESTRITDAGPIARATAGLVANCLAANEASRIAAQKAVTALALGKIRAYIEDHLGDQRLSAAMIS
jgi:hypothetical protein